MSSFRFVTLFGVLLALGAVSLLLSACGGGGGGGSGSSGPPSYTITASALAPAAITSGSTSTTTIQVSSQNGYTGSVGLSCSISAASAQAPRCSFSTSTVTVNSGMAATATLTVSTSSSTPGGNYTVSITGTGANNLAPSNGPQTLTLTTAAVIEHVVVIFQENRSPDNLFHDPVLISRGADIASSGVNSLGQTIPLTPIDLGTSGANPQNYDVDHSHRGFVSMYDGGKMDGADLVKCTVPAPSPPSEHPNPQFKYVNPADVQPYFALAEQYTFGDRMFQTNQGPSFPAHKFIISGTAAPTATSALFAAENTFPPKTSAGCIAQPGTTV